ncbi:hypothetical protein PANT_27d00097 [Moesziomyces antarcticus T-34]|uniref:DUF829-domain-containing protein n=1 Tax=Pseudozyma antarctica (strain T-34) TaxID=1151754 RepID=M9LTH1_PSEA3|nr:hypothetical protein PANT_27d00097 [Moesziomyces antarcticus T-34]
MPPTKSSKTGKASKAAKAILHPKSTLAAARANHSRASSIDEDRPQRSPASSIRKTPSNASMASSSTKPLSRAASVNASPAAATTSLPTAAAPAPSVLAPPIGTDILSTKKQAIARAEPVQQPATNTASVAAAASASVAAAREAPAASSGAAHPLDVPYTIDEVPNTKTVPAQDAKEDVKPTLPQNGATGQSEEPASNDKFAKDVAAVIAGSDPAPDQEPSAAAVAAPTPLTTPIVAKSADATSQAVSASSDATPIVASSELAKASAYTPPELTRLQHNTFVSRRTDASRVAARALDASALPAPLRPVGGRKTLARTPSHVVIFGWMDAPIRLVAKYAQPYTALFPDATVLIQLSDGKSYLARENVRRTQLQRIISEITSASPEAETEPFEVVKTTDVGDSTITLIDAKEARSSASSDGDGEAPARVGGFVIHSFSDGGAGNLALFLDEMARRKGPAPRVHSLIMDSSPGKSNPKSGSFAFTMHLANRPRVRAIVRLLVYIGLYMLKIWTKITGQLGRGELMRKRLNSLRSWSWITAAHSSNAATAEKSEYPPRMYMYTKADRLIPWQFVEEHAHHLGQIRGTKPGVVQMENEAERAKLLKAVESGAGDARDAPEYRVELRRWDTPPHCSIGRADFVGYWSAVVDFYSNVLSRP